MKSRTAPLRTTRERETSIKTVSKGDAAARSKSLSLPASVGRIADFARLFTGSVPMRMQLAALFMVLGASVTEGIGITLMVPLLGLLGDHAGSGRARDGAAELLEAIGLPLSLPLVLGIFVAAVLTRAAFVRRRDVMLLDLQYRFTDALRRRLYRAIEAAAWPFIAKERLSNLATALSGEVDSVGRGTFFFLRFPSLAALGVVQLAIVLAIAPLLTLSVMACGAAIALLARLRRGDAYLAGKQMTLGRQAIFDEISDFLASLKLAKSHNAEERHRLAFESALARQNEVALGYNRRSADAQMLVQFCSAVMLGAFVYVGATVAHLAMPQLLIMIVVFARLMPLFMQLQQSANSVWQMLPAFDGLARLIARCEAAREPMTTGGTERLSLRDKIELSGVSFRYDKERGPDVLNGLDLEVAAGSVVAVVGASGGGKSTLADLLMGLLTPDAGSLSVDGSPLVGSRLAAWRRSIAYVPQENFLFNQSIRANLAWGSPDATDTEIGRVLALTGAASLVEAMPEGLDTIVGERGSRLSGGERQRLILARALLRRPTLLILDEATSALDQESERAVWAVIDRLRGNTTVLFIAHRLSTLRNADRVAVLDGGRIIQFGTWDALMQDDGGRFALLVRAGGVLENVTP